LYLVANAISEDCVSWQTIFTNTGAALGDIQAEIFANGLFVASALRSGLFVSSDGITWTQTYSNSQENVYSITYGNDIYLALSSNINSGSRYCLTSSDGITWTKNSFSFNYNTSSKIAFGNGLFLVPISTYGNYVTSPDGITWTQRNIGETTVNEFINDAAYGKNTFLLLTSGSVYISTNAINWTKYNLPDTIDYNSGQVAFAGNTFLFLKYLLVPIQLVLCFHLATPYSGQNMRLGQTPLQML
jgi:hypothetical protein